MLVVYLEQLTASVESHASCAGIIMTFDAALIDQLLSGNITCSKEYRSGYTLG